MIKGKKLPDEIDDPVDIFFYRLANNLSNFFRNTNHTPNMITTYSFLFGLLAVYFLYKRKIVLFTCFYIMFYFLDCLDGFFARKYDMVTVFGDFYDHAKDLIMFILICSVLYIKYRSSITLWNLLFIGLFLILLFMFLGCQQKYYNTSHNTTETLDFFKSFCRDKNQIKWNRFFGPGVFQIIFILTIIYIWYKDSKASL